MTDQQTNPNPPSKSEITIADRFRKAILAAAIVVGIGWAFGF
jgi:hypothetical protein